MKKVVSSALLSAFTLIFASHAQAANFNPATAQQLQDDLDTAAANNDPAGNTITLNANTTYRTTDKTVPGVFTYNTGTANNLTINGAGMGSSVLDGNDSTQVLDIFTSGSGVAIQISNLTIQNGNAASGFAGVKIQNAGGGADILVDSCEIQDNVMTGVEVGGAVFETTDNLTVRNSIISNNAGFFEGGGSFFGGTLTLTNNLFDANKSNLVGPGGGQAAGFFGANTGLLNAEENVFQNNEATFQVAHFSGQMNINRNSFLNNTSNMALGGVGFRGPVIFQNSGADIVLTNNIFSGNTTALTASAQLVGGGAIVGGGQNIDIINNTVVNNSLSTTGATPPEGGGLFLLPNSPSASYNLYNNIVFGNSTNGGEGEDIFFNASFQPTAVLNLFNSDFIETCVDTGSGPNCFNAAGIGTANIGLDPLLIDPLNPTNPNFNLGVGSPAIDAGTTGAPNLPATDFAGNARVVGGQVDMGALESQGQIAVNPVSLNFGTVGIGTDSSQTFTISNGGAGLLNVTGLVLSDNVNYSIDPNGGSNPCGSLSFTLNSGESCTIEVTFSPNSNGSFDATITVSSDDPAQPSLTISVTGVGNFNTFRGGGCGLGGVASPEGYLALLAMLPLAWAFRRRRNR